MVKIMEWIKRGIPYLIIILVVVFLRMFIITPVTVDGRSMYPTLKDKDIILLKKHDHKYEYGDIVILNYLNTRLVKRIIGLPNDHIKIEKGVLYINGKKVKDDYSSLTYDFDLKELGYNKIPEGYYFVMGDNRKASSDSRVIGLIKKSDILGTARFRIFPFQNFGIIKNKKS